MWNIYYRASLGAKNNVDLFYWCFEILKYYFLFIKFFCIKFSYYTIVGSTTIRGSSEYNVSVTSEGYTEPIEVEVGIKGFLADTTETYNNHEIVTVEPGTTKLVTFKIGKIIPGDYKIYGKGLKGETIDQDVDLGINTKPFNVFIQTDKSIYKPGDAVKFRIVFLDANLKGVKVLENCTIFIIVS